MARVARTTGKRQANVASEIGKRQKHSKGYQEEARSIRAYGKNQMPILARATGKKGQ